MQEASLYQRLVCLKKVGALPGTPKRLMERECVGAAHMEVHQEYDPVLNVRPCIEPIEESLLHDEYLALPPVPDTDPRIATADANPNPDLDMRPSTSLLTYESSPFVERPTPAYLTHNPPLLSIRSIEYLGVQQRHVQQIHGERPPPLCKSHTEQDYCEVDVKIKVGDSYLEEEEGHVPTVEAGSSSSSICACPCKADGTGVLVVGADQTVAGSWLPYAAIDAEAACVALQARGYSVTLLTGPRATKDRVCSALQELAVSYRNLGLWYAGHSCNAGEGLVLYDTDPAADGPTAEALAEPVSRGGAGHFFSVLDCCYAGPLAQRLKRRLRQRCPDLAFAAFTSTPADVSRTSPLNVALDSYQSFSARLVCTLNQHQERVLGTTVLEQTALGEDPPPHPPPDP
eukprot:EG_transcript_15091